MLNAFREHLDASDCNFNVAEDCCGVLVELAPHGFTSMVSDGGDVNQPDNPIIGPGSGYDGAAILSGHHFAPIRPNRGDHPVEARAVGQIP
jgi:hypothetical protein